MRPQLLRRPEGDPLTDLRTELSAQQLLATRDMAEPLLTGLHGLADALAVATGVAS